MDLSMPTPPPAQLAPALQEFLQLVDVLRPDLHRYVSRLVGSAIDGEDVVQDTLAKAMYALSQSPELPELRPWLFRIARNTAIDHLRRYDRRHGEALPADDTMSDDSFRDPEVLRAALASFLALPPTQRSAVILKDVLDESLEDIATHLDTTVAAVKSLLVRGRATLKEQAANGPPTRSVTPEERVVVQQYVELFNRRDWTGLQAMLLEDVRLDLVSKSQRQGKAVGMYFGRYAQEPDVELRLGRCEGRRVLGVFRGEKTTPDSIILLEVRDGRVSLIRDFRYVPYLAKSLTFSPE